MFDWRKLSDDEICKAVMKQHPRLKSARKVFEPMWNLNYKLFLPRRHDMSKKAKEGDIYGVDIFDANPAQAARKFSIGFSGQMVEKGTGDQWWLNFEVPDQELMKVDKIKEYLQDYAVQIRYGYDRSTFYREFPHLIKNASVTYGIMTAEDDLAADRVVFRNRRPKDHWLGVNQYGDVDIDHFELVMTAKTLAEKFGENNLPEAVKKQMDPKSGDPFTEYEVVCGVYKNGSIRNGSSDPTDKPHIAFYIMPSREAGKEWHLLGKDGQDYKPINLRIGERTESGYPISMASDSLTAAVYGNLLSKHSLHASHLSVRPAVLASETLRDQIMKNKLNPGSKTYIAKPEERIEAINEKLQYQEAEHQILKNDDVVNDIFYITFLEMLTRRESSVKTLGEIYEMLEEKLGLLGPVIEATEDDALESSTEIIARHERHRLPDIPQQLLDYIMTEGQTDSQGRKITLKNKYVGKLHRLKRMLPQAKSSIEQVAIMKEFKELAPNSLVLVKMRKTLERILSARGMPQDEINSDADLAKIDAEIERKQAIEEQLELAERVAKVVPSVTKDAVDPNSPAALIAEGAR